MEILIFITPLVSSYGPGKRNYVRKKKTCIFPLSGLGCSLFLVSIGTRKYWNILGNCLGKFIKIYEQTNIQSYTSYAQICAYMDLSKALPEEIRMIWDDEDWMQNLDYEQIPFRFCRFHKYSHLFRECPLNFEPKQKPGKEGD